ncbi:unnamed protein product [Parascedosporium putredinis]|uniref:chitin synthase n=1 Tax=Parascedosporium putredinis TaxID=1442378 RepID=A0A9P1MCP9_9PEZI|nr:unnamed protein product [Parascedosporium putredinis]CAI7998823.1 unnamed protein product [Parascedosporium putredinis]
MAGSRLSMYSLASESPGAPEEPDSSLLSVVVNTWLTAAQAGPDGKVGGTVDRNLAARAWEHARRRAEDGCIILGFGRYPTIPPLRDAIQPLDTAPGRLGSYSYPEPHRHLAGASVSLSQGGIDTAKGLLNIPAEAGYRAFDVFYYLLTTASTPAEREFLGLKAASNYTLLSRSGTYSPPSYLPTADDAAAADDFRAALKEIGIKGSAHRNLISTLAGLLKLGNVLDYGLDSDELDDIIEDVSGLLGVEPDVLARQCSTEDRQTFVGGLYEALVDWVISKANEAIAAQMLTLRDTASVDGRMPSPAIAGDSGDTVCITVVDIPDPTLGKAIAMRNIFDDTQGINQEMIQDGIEIAGAGSSVIREMQNAVTEAGPDLGIMTGPVGRDRHHELEKREVILEKVAHAADNDGFLKKLLFPVAGEGINLGRAGRIDLAALLSASRSWFHLSVHPTDDSPLLRAWRLPEWANRRNRHLDFTADFDIEEFVQRFSALGCKEGREGIETWILERGWSNGEVVVGKERVWIRENAWWEAESMLDLKPMGGVIPMPTAMPSNPFETSYSAGGSGYFPAGLDGSINSSRDQLVGHQRTFSQGNMSQITLSQNNRAPSGDTYKGQVYYNNDGEFVGNIDPELADGKKIETRPQTTRRRLWVALVWALTFWIPSPLLRYVGRMRRPDVRMAWREKVVLVFLIFLINACVVFWIIGFGKVLCPNKEKAWSRVDVSNHPGGDDFWVSIHGKVYDITKFWKQQHSDIPIKTTQDRMEPFGGLDLTIYFPIPFAISCRGLGIGERFVLLNNVTAEYPDAVHSSGKYTPYTSSELANEDWYTAQFLPKIKEYFKGDLVWDPKDGNQLYSFLNSDVTDIVKQNPGGDITELWDDLLLKSKNTDDESEIANSMNCIKNHFYQGIPDFRLTARCQVNGYILLAFTIIICSVILVKFLAALQFGSKRRPAPQEKFVICQVPAYTEGEDSLRKAIDSLTALQYDNKRKLICVICDGIIVGQGNDRPTPKIILDILGLNYGKVYSGLYEFEGNVVPYLVVVKVGKESEQSGVKPGNRGKRDSQILLMSFLNRVHHRSPMNPLELEMFHQINNVIGVDPELYEYLFMVDADTAVREDSLNRLVAACANDARIAGICGETGLQNDEKSWWTMIQVYEYFISHHLAKAFESLFGSVTCLPGCFSMYRLRTVDKGKPLIISDDVIKDYAICDVDTLHKKNLLSLGEDRYLTTLMTKYFPYMTYKFIPDAYCQTAAPESWSVLLSQRRRWINSTIHNLVELLLPLFSIVMLGAVYGLQALIFILKRQWQHIGWMIIYILAFPIYSFVLPIYSFWNQDNFSWGNTRIVVGEKGDKKIVAVDDVGFDPRSIPLQRWDDYAFANNLPGRRGGPAEREYLGDEQYEMDEVRSVYSSAPQGSLHAGMAGRPAFMPPSPTNLGAAQRQSSFPYGDSALNRQSMASFGGDISRRPSPYQDGRASAANFRSGSNLSPAMGVGVNRSSAVLGYSGGTRTPLSGTDAMRSTTSFDFQRGHVGPDDAVVIEAIQSVLREVDLDTVTKKQVRALVEQRLQTELSGERRTFMDRQIDQELANM